MKKNRKVIAVSLLMVTLVAVGAVSVFSKTDKKAENCFELVLPVTFIMPDGSTIIVEDKDGYAELKAWYQDHPDVKEHLALQYPVDITYGEGKTVTINNDEEMARAKAACGDKGGEGRNCS
jgi:hypothetical protein